MKTLLSTLFVLVITWSLGLQAFAQAPTITSTLSQTENVKAGELVTFTVSLTQGNIANNTAVKGRISLLGDNVATRRQLVNLQYQQAEGEEWQSLSLNEAGVVEFGAENGFPLEARTFNFRARFNLEGSYNLQMAVVPAAGGDALASVNQSITISQMLEPTINSTLDVISAGESKIRSGEDVLFRVFVEAHDRAGDAVNVRFRFTNANQHDNVSLVSYNFTSDTEFEKEELTALGGGVWLYGPEGGSELEDFNQLFSINLSEAGTYNYVVELLRTDGNVLAAVNESIEVLAGATIASTLNNRQNTMPDTETDFSVTTTMGAWAASTNVRYKFSFDPAQAENVSLQYAQGTEFVALTLDENGVAYIGEAAGMPFTASTTNMKVTFAEAGVYNYTIELINPANNNLAVARSAERVLVGVSDAEPTIASTLHNKADVVKDTEVEFMVNTTRGAIAENTPVRLQFTLATPDQAENIALMADQDGNGEFEALAFENGVAYFGAAEGFMLADASMNFKVTFNAPGTYNYTLALVPAAGGEALATATESVVVGGVAGIKDKFVQNVILVYPTVSNGAVSVELGRLRNAQIVIQDMLGRTVASVDNANVTARIETDKLSKGTYFVRVVSGSEMAMSRFIVK
ncbi:T9SS type A sorting domain-containing protein [Pontibacter sp. SGAir0037]|uniref:T9SS type A sorting domain-containing protein n=1 Tax=Pontibacter sp. SGAir0037 TaxID=2571030 RepID=UPI0010CD2C0B|nr:T9SS type A sorting domain-containing protein [Pontibacter sp. SGAir0037]QCR23687.1 hypothetical protein C1N53_15940 [Pontibacter sp. SGAir0037]